MPRFLNTYWVEFFTLRMKALLAACKPLILLDFHRSFNDTRTMSNDEILTVKETANAPAGPQDDRNEELPAFWSVGCLTHKSESFRLRFVLFAAVRSAGFPLFPPSPAHFFRILGQNWVKGCNIRRDWQTATLRHSPHYLSSYHKWRKGQRFVGVFVHHGSSFGLSGRAKVIAADIVIRCDGVGKSCSGIGYCGVNDHVFRDFS